MNTGFPCKCGCSKVHALLKKSGTTLSVEFHCSKCKSSYTEYLAMDGADFIDWDAFKKKFDPEGYEFDLKLRPKEES